MLIIPVKDGENIDRALKRFKRKFDRTKTMKQLRERKQFNKPSVTKRQQLLKAKYIQNIRTNEEKG
jgi:small subunit ribosomal protein S21